MPSIGRYPRGRAVSTSWRSARHALEQRDLAALVVVDADTEVHLGGTVVGVERLGDAEDRIAQGAMATPASTDSLMTARYSRWATAMHAPPAKRVRARRGCAAAAWVLALADQLSFPEVVQLLQPIRTPGAALGPRQRR